MQREGARDGDGDARVGWGAGRLLRSRRATWERDMSSKRSPKLSDYRAKRDFKRTSEPAAEGPRKPDSAMPAPRRGSRSPRAPRFVVQEHHARRLHWDLRLEHDGVLMSWAVPNGMPQDRQRTASRFTSRITRSSYIDFEGEIPRAATARGGSRSGTAAPMSEKSRADKVVVVFHGERVRGATPCFRTRREGLDDPSHGPS